MTVDCAETQASAVLGTVQALVSSARLNFVIARSEATKQSSPALPQLDCFAEPVIGPRDFARVRWLAMTSCGKRRKHPALSRQPPPVGAHALAVDVQQFLAGAMVGAALDRARRKNGLRFDRGGKLFSHHALGFGLAAGAAAGDPHEAERDHALRFPAQQRRLAETPAREPTFPGIGHLHGGNGAAVPLFPLFETSFAFSENLTAPSQYFVLPAGYCGRAKSVLMKSRPGSSVLIEHDLFRKPVATFRNHAAGRRGICIGCRSGGPTSGARNAQSR